MALIDTFVRQVKYKGSRQAPMPGSPETVQEHEVIRLSREEQVAFLTALLTPSEPGPRLRRAVESYRQKAGL